MQSANYKNKFYLILKQISYRKNKPVPDQFGNYKREYYIIQDMKRRFPIWMEHHRLYNNEAYLNQSSAEISCFLSKRFRSLTGKSLTLNIICHSIKLIKKK